MGRLPVLGSLKLEMDNVDARLYEGEVVAAEAHLPLFAEDAAGEFVEGALEVGEGDAPVHRQAFDLIEVPLVGGVGCLVAVALAGHDDPYGRLALLHGANLHGRGLGSHEHGVFAFVVGLVNPEGRPHVAGGVSLGDVEHLEVVEVPFDFGAFYDVEAHGSEGVAYFSEHLGGGVQAADGGGPAGQCDVDGVGAVFGFGLGAREVVLALG